CQYRRTGLHLDVNAPPRNGVLDAGNNLFDLYEIRLTSGVPYTFHFAKTGGIGTPHLLLFGNPGSTNAWLPRSVGLLDLTANGAYTPSKTDVYAVLVITEAQSPSNYSLDVAAPGADVASNEGPGITRLTSVSPNPGAGPVTVSFSAAGAAPLG